MNLFSELYNCYYLVTARILAQAARNPLTRQQIYEIAQAQGYQESALEIAPRLLEGDWALLWAREDGRYTSRLGKEPFTPFTALQKSWLKALLKDRRITLFFSDQQLKNLEKALEDVEPLFDPSDFLYFDRYRDSAPFRSVMYRKHFSAILEAIRSPSPLRIVYYSGKNRIMEHTWFPSRLEYSPKDGKFRLCAFYRRASGRWRLDVLNVARILRLEAVSSAGSIGSLPDVDTFLEASLSHEPLVLEVLDDRNALERTMLHFASYQKTVERTEDSRRYRCSIYYDVRWETELLIQVLSFGPMVKVLGPEHFLAQVRERVRGQQTLVPPK